MYIIGAVEGSGVAVEAVQRPLRLLGVCGPVREAVGAVGCPGRGASRPEAGEAESSGASAREAGLGGVAVSFRRFAAGARAVPGPCPVPVSYHLAGGGENGPCAGGPSPTLRTVAPGSLPVFDA